MSCQGVIDFVTRESGRFSEQIYSRMFPKSPLIGLIKKAAFPEGIGETISNLTYERQAPTDAEPSWTSIVDTTSSQTNLPTTEGGDCLPPAHKIGAGSTVRSWSVKRRVLEGPDFCVEQLRSPFQVQKQLTSILDTLADYAMLEWEIFYRHQLARVVKRTAIAIAAGPVEVINAPFPMTAAASGTATCADMSLSQGLLNRYRTKLRRDGASVSAMGMDSGAAVFTLLAGEETLDRLIFNNADIRQDLRWGKPSELLRAYGVERSYRGFFHMIDSFPMRFTCASGNYTEVPAFVSSAATKGYKSDVNGPYEGSSGTVATIESAFIFDPEVMTARIPKPITSPAPGYRFDPMNYSGVFSVRNILDRICNPDGTIIFHRGIMAAGIEPVHPERGVMFYFKNCATPLQAVTDCT